MPDTYIPHNGITNRMYVYFEADMMFKYNSTNFDVFIMWALSCEGYCSIYMSFAFFDVCELWSRSDQKVVYCVNRTEKFVFTAFSISFFVWLFSASFFQLFGWCSILCDLLYVRSRACVFFTTLKGRFYTLIVMNTHAFESTALVFVCMRVHERERKRARYHYCSFLHYFYRCCGVFYMSMT